MSHSMTLDADPMLMGAASDQELGIELLDEMVEEDFWDGFVVGASLGAAAAGGAIAIAVAT